MSLVPTSSSVRSQREREREREREKGLRGACEEPFVLIRARDIFRGTRGPAKVDSPKHVR